MAATKLIIGLGNPDPEYQNTRHNVGFMFLDYLAKTANNQPIQQVQGPAFVPSSGRGEFIDGQPTTNNEDIWEFDKKTNSLISKTKLEKTAVILAKPQTYVNKSGEATTKLKNFYKVKPENIIVIQDDLDIPFGNTKISFDKNSGGHKGIESIMKALKTKKFYRLRIGLAKPALQKARQKSDKKRDEFIRNYVLSKFTPSEKETLKNIFNKSYEKLISVIR